MLAGIQEAGQCKLTNTAYCEGQTEPGPLCEHLPDMHPKRDDKKGAKDATRRAGWDICPDVDVLMIL